MESSGNDWGLWLLAALVVLLFVTFFGSIGVALYNRLRRLLGLIEAAPEHRRARVEAEAKAGGRYPFWLRAIRVLVILVLVVLLAIIIWRRFG